MRTEGMVQLAIDVPSELRERFKREADGKPLREFLVTLLDSFAAKKPRKTSKKTTISHKIENP